MSYSNSSIPKQRTGKALQLARFIAALAWAVSSRLLASSSARGITSRFNLDLLHPLMSALFLLFLLAVGFALLEMIARRPSTARSVLGLPKRESWGREWLIGAALGWGMIVLAVLPLAITGSLHVTFWTDAGVLKLLTVNLLTLLVSSLTVEVVFRGYPYRCLAEAIGPIGSTLCMSVLFALMQVVINGANSTAAFIAILMGVLYSVAWNRTHGLWLGWGMHFAWVVSLGTLFGLPVSGTDGASVLVQTMASGRRWFTGGSYGPEAAYLTAVALLIGLIVLVRVTKEYAWNYTHSPIIPGGYPMEAKPPAAHVAMEEQSRPALVQILPSSPQGMSSTGNPPPPPPPPPLP